MIVHLRGHEYRSCGRPACGVISRDRSIGLLAPNSVPNRAVRGGIGQFDGAELAIRQSRAVVENLIAFSAGENVKGFPDNLISNPPSIVGEPLFVLPR